MVDPTAPSAPSAAAPSAPGSSDSDLATAFSKVLDSMAAGIITSNKPQVHDSDDD